MKETQITNTSWKTFTLSFSRFQRRKKLVSRDLNVASYCPSNTIQKVLNLSEFMRPHSILQCLVSVVEYVHICKQAWGENHLINSKTSILLLLSPFHVFFFFFFSQGNVNNQRQVCKLQHKLHILYTKLCITFTNAHNTKNTGQPSV